MASNVSVSVSVLSSGVGSGPLVPSSATVTVLVSSSTPAGCGLSTVTEIESVAWAPPPATTGNVADTTPLPAAVSPQVTGGSVVQAANVVPGGSVSVTSTLVAPMLPLFVTVTA